MATAMWRHHRRHGVHGSLLDPAVSNIGELWLHREVSQCPARQARAGPQKRRARLSMATTTGKLWTVDCFLPAHGPDLCLAQLYAAAADAHRLWQPARATNAKGPDRDEHQIAARDQRSYWCHRSGNCARDT